MRGKTLRNFLVDNFIQREAQLVRENTALTIDIAAERLRRVFAEIALEMAASETSIVDTAFIELVIEATFSGDLSTLDMGRLKYKAGSLGFMEEDAQKGYRRFPHTEISNHFLSHGIMNSFGDPGIRRVLSRAALETDFMSVFSEEFAEVTEDIAGRVMTILERTIERERSSSERLEVNLSALWVASLSRSMNSECRLLSDRQLLDTAIVGTAVEAKLNRIIMNRIDLRGADLRSLSFTDCATSTMIIDDETKFGQSWPETTHLQIMAESGTTSVRGDAIIDWLKSHSHDVDHDGAMSNAEALLWRVAYSLRRRYAIRDSDDDYWGRLLRHPLWPEIEKILRTADRIIRDPNRGAAGSNDYFVRIRDPEGLMRKADPKADQIWKEVRALG